MKDKKPTFNGEDMEVLSREVKFKGFFEIQQLSLRHKLFEGGWSDAFTRELFVRGQAVVVLLYDPQADALVMIEQFRVGAMEDHRSPWLMELVAGIVEPGESPEEVARRESMEEAGCEITDLIKLYDYWVSPGGTNETVVIFCGRVDSSDVRGVYGLKHEHEDIRVEVVPVESAIKAVEDGIINNAATIMAIQWLQLNKSRIQTEWS